MSFVTKIESIVWAYLDFYALLKSFILTLNLLFPVQPYSLIYNSKCCLILYLWFLPNIFSSLFYNLSPIITFVMYRNSHNLKIQE